MTTMPELAMRTVSRPSEKLAKQVQDIYATAFRPAVRVPFPELLKAITDGKKTLFVAETTENLVGFAVVQRLACQTVYYLEYIAIAASFRGRGVGRSLLEYLAQSVRSDQKAEGILFEVEPVDLASAQDRLVGERRLEFYRRSRAEIIKGAMAYRMPNLTSQGSLPMTLMWLPLLLMKNAKINRARVVEDTEVWSLSSERLVQISGDTFHPETYSPYISLDVVEEILQYLAQKAARGSYLEPYLDVHSINYLRRVGLLDLPTRAAENLATTDVSSGGLRIKPCLAYSRDGRLFITQGEQSYMVDRFMLNLLTVMNGRTVEEWAAKVLEASLSEQSTTRMPDTALHRFARGLEWVATYLARAGMLEDSTHGLDVAKPVGAQ
jgi:ribosomal protein S18 acetylase RimI-like enzyme